MKRSATGALRLAARALLAHAPAASSGVHSALASQGFRAAAPASAALRRLWQDPWASPLAQQQFAGFASEAGGKGTAGDEGRAAAAEDAGTSGSEEEQPTVEQLTADLQEREKAIEELQTKVNDLADSFKRSLAEMENLRQRTSRQIENAHKFAVEPIIKSLLDVADNLQRAGDAVPGGVLDGSEQLDAEKAQRLLKSLLEGVKMTEGVLMKVFNKHGVEQYNPDGDKFDPNLHQAMFEVPDASKEAGMIAVVTKRGYKMHDRILRAAEVGVYKAP